MRNFQWVVLSGTASLELSKKICERLGKPLGEMHVRKFSDGECFVEIKENVRGREVFLIQSTSKPADSNLMELLISIDALKRASAKEITAVIPYYGYARQDRKVAPRTPISAKLVADLLTAAGATRVVSMDMHAGQIQGFFNIPFDHLYASPALLKAMLEILETEDALSEEKAVVVSPDAGGVERARAFAKRTKSSVAMIDKRRIGPNVAKAMNVVGDVQNRIAFLVDDMIDTAGTLCEAANALKNSGATRIFAAATHGVFSGEAIARIENSVIEKVIVTDTIELSEEAKKSSKIIQVSVATLLAEAIDRIHHDDSVSSLFV